MEPSSGVYGLAGLQIGILTGFGDSITRLGLNLGGGYAHDLGNFLPFGELKFVVGDFDQFVFNAGVRWLIGG